MGAHSRMNCGGCAAVPGCSMSVSISAVRREHGGAGDALPRSGGSTIVLSECRPGTPKLTALNPGALRHRS